MELSTQSVKAKRTPLYRIPTRSLALQVSGRLVERHRQQNDRKTGLVAAMRMRAQSRSLPPSLAEAAVTRAETLVFRVQGHCPVLQAVANTVVHRMRPDVLA